MLPPRPATTRPGLPPRSTTRPADAQRALIDWTVKDELTFTATAPWDWLASAHAEDECAALAAFAAGTPASAAANPIRAWQQHLLYWAHPTQIPPPSYTQQMNKINARKTRGGQLTADEAREVAHGDLLIREW